MEEHSVFYNIFEDDGYEEVFVEYLEKNIDKLDTIFRTICFAKRYDLLETAMTSGFANHWKPEYIYEAFVYYNRRRSIHYRRLNRFFSELFESDVVYSFPDNIIYMLLENRQYKQVILFHKKYIANTNRDIYLANIDKYYSIQCYNSCINRTEVYTINQWIKYEYPIDIYVFAIDFEDILKSRRRIKKSTDKFLKPMVSKLKEIDINDEQYPNLFKWLYPNHLVDI